MTLEVVNLAVGVIAIILSLISIVASVIFSLKASSTLDMVKNKADAIEKDVRDRLDDLVKRAAPSEQERAMSAVLPDFFKALLANPEVMRTLLEKVIGQDSG